MEKTTIYYNAKTKPRSPLLIVGLPGIGNVGSLVGEHLRTELKAKKFATLYSPHFPHQVVMLKSGGIRLVSNRFYLWKNPSKEKNVHDVIILVGDFQALSSEGQYEINEKIIKFFKKLGGRTVYTIGGYNATNQYVQTPRVFAVTTDKSQIPALKKNGIIFGVASGMIWGSAGLLLAFSKKYKLTATCIMGETGMLDVDAHAAKAILDALVKHLGLNVNLDNMEKISKETEKMLGAMEEAAKKEQQGNKENFTYIR
ncbi:MAG: proteasome assembly chaperone family protein [Candidatus Micrarchaeota archaeon]|nr:proteasome assembly chaperone family protein [Candidatus Micrarchaeota archaeon]MDE1847484.1 proteasome assembly chaperone family protein [Candidatus Micrarchaeota archaeon]MDE1864021.1 proteasome assembly chaperone family protein [Candidatus Micrarchaeota archaeon]